MNLATWSALLTNTVATLAVAVAILSVFALVARNQVSVDKDAKLVRFQTESAATISLANARAAEANEKAAAAEKGTAQALAAAAAATAKGQELEIAAAEQRERAAHAERDLLELQERFRPRVISADTMTRLISALRRSNEKGPVRVGWVSGDAEAALFGRQFVEALTAAGWETTSTEFVAVTAFGIRIIVAGNDLTPTYAGALQSILKSMGLDAGGEVNPGLAGGSPVTLLIGTKPGR